MVFRVLMHELSASSRASHVLLCSLSPSPHLLHRHPHFHLHSFLYCGLGFLKWLDGRWLFVHFLGAKRRLNSTGSQNGFPLQWGRPDSWAGLSFDWEYWLGASTSAVCGQGCQQTGFCKVHRWEQLGWRTSQVSWNKQNKTNKSKEGCTPGVKNFRIFYPWVVLLPLSAVWCGDPQVTSGLSSSSLAPRQGMSMLRWMAHSL